MPSRKNSCRALASHPGRTAGGLLQAIQVCFPETSGMSLLSGIFAEPLIKHCSHSCHPPSMHATSQDMSRVPLSCRAVTGGCALTHTPCLAAFPTALKTICVPPSEASSTFLPSWVSLSPVRSHQLLT